MKTAISTSCMFSAIVCGILMLIGILGSDMLLTLIQTPEEVFADSKLYLDIYAWGLPFVFFYNIATGIFSALGDSKTPFYFLAVSSLSNIAVDIWFVTKFHMGVAGVAWATFLCQGVSCILAMAVVCQRLKKMETAQKAALFDAALLKEIIRIAIPSTLQQSFISFGNIMIQSIINGFGASVMAGYSAAVKLNNLVITSFTTLGNGISNYTAQNLGAKKPSRIQEGFRAGVRLVWILSIPLFALYFFGGSFVLRLFMTNPTKLAMQTGILYLMILSPFYLVISAKLVADGILRGAGMMKEFMIATFSDLILRVLFAFLFSKTALGATGIWCAWPIGWCTGMVLSIFFYRHGEWKTER